MTAQLPKYGAVHVLSVIYIVYIICMQQPQQKHVYIYTSTNIRVPVDWERDVPPGISL